MNPNPKPTASNPAQQSLIATGFSQAASQYAQHARIQARSAQQLWAWAQQQHAQQAPQQSPQAAALVDVGCGTGFLTAQLLAYASCQMQSHMQHCKQSQQATPMAVHAIDLAPGMLQQLSTQLQHPQLHTHCLDGSQLQAHTLAWPQPTWVLSNLCMQWFDDIPKALQHWLGFAQTISVAVLLDGSFTAWKAAHQAAGQPCRLRPLPTAHSILGCLHSLQQQGRIQGFQHQQVQFIDPHPNGLAFVRSLKAIGAHTPAHTQRPSQLRRVLAALQQLQRDGSMNYNIGFFHIQQ